LLHRRGSLFQLNFEFFEEIALAGIRLLDEVLVDGLKISQIQYRATVNTERSDSIATSFQCWAARSSGATILPPQKRLIEIDP
jgi:hypothetical protein